MSGFITSPRVHLVLWHIDSYSVCAGNPHNLYAAQVWQFCSFQSTRMVGCAFFAFALIQWLHKEEWRMGCNGGLRLLTRPTSSPVLGQPRWLEGQEKGNEPNVWLFTARRFQGDIVTDLAGWILVTNNQRFPAPPVSSLAYCSVF